MTRPLLFTALAAVLLAGACETTGDNRAPGFYDTRVESDRYRITYVVPGGMPRQRAEDFLMLRAADTALMQGYDWFRVVNRSAETAGGGSRYSPSVSVGTGGISYGGSSSFGVGVGTTFPLGSGPRPVLNMEILLGRGEPPRDPSIYNAEDVAQTIRARL